VILVVDVGGSHVKLIASGQHEGGFRIWEAR